MPTLTVPCPAGQVSDGYHTFDDLYAHRGLLLVALMQAHPNLAWRSRRHDDGTSQAGWWLAGLRLPTGDISYHMPDALWPLLDAAPVATLDRAPKWDGHDSAEVLRRLHRWLAPPDPAATTPDPA
jgi:hypothetical protein